MVLLIGTSKAKGIIIQNIRKRRLNMGLTQKGLSKRSGVKLPSLRKFEQTGSISLESFLKILIVVDCLESVTEATSLPNLKFSSIDDVLSTKGLKTRKRGWRQ